MSTETWSIGELARATGLTVRTLHHYDDIGLVRPSHRSPAGHRRYAYDDVRRLHRVLALRGFGFGLPDIAGLLDGAGPGAREVLLRQLDQVTDRIERARALERRLTMVLGQFDDAGHQSATALISLMEGMIAVEHTYTPEELERMAADRREAAEQLSPEELAAMSERRRAAWEAMTPEQQEEMVRSRPRLP
ncbi:MerR family transcriptional regulator [Symbioplanes lichenis]|uniref:MerR family transcriptional regulator n=1 Tax=Symbioplanes lichenis TaxID=1629072 RepID=UPI0027395C49|nr:MerR family transcriptional regulator [Actinoplanes lichenis]